MISQQQFEKDFEDFVSEMRTTLIKKNFDYTGASNDPLFNFRKAEQMGIPGWKAALIRFGDKFSRMCTFAKMGELKVSDENFLDTVKDAANYLFLMQELFKENQHDKNTTTS